MESTEEKVFCPYFSELLELKKDQLYCRRSKSLFSPKLTREFLEAVNFETIKNDEVKLTSRRNGYFFCIRCGTKMDKLGEMHEKCIVCGVCAHSECALFNQIA
jgi:hypothetical protein